MITVHKQLTDNVKARISCSNMHGSDVPTGLGEIEDDKFVSTFRVQCYKDDPALRLVCYEDNMVWFLSKCGGTLDAEVVKRGIFGSPLYQGFGLSESLPYTKEQAKEMFASKFSTQRLVEGVESAQKRIATLHDYIRAADALMVTLQATGVADCFETYWEEVEKAYYQFKEKPEL